jgi:hypothetical protein
MDLATICKFQCGERGAIDRVARSGAAFWIGAILVLVTSIPRQYDQMAISEQTWRWIFGPLVFSIISGSFLFFVVYFLRTFVKAKKGELEQTHGLVSSWVGFMGLFWMTAPIAWLYAIPVERMLTSPVAQAQANLWLLALVALWRVGLMARVLRVTCEWSFGRALSMILAAASAEVVALAFLSPAIGRSIMAGMGGMRNSPAEELLVNALMTTLMVSLFVFPCALVLGAFGPWSKSAKALPVRTRDHLPWIGLISIAVIWVAIAIFPQREVVRNVELDRLFAAGEYREVIDLMNSSQPGDYSPSRELPPKAYEWEIVKQLPALITELRAGDAEWVQLHFVSRLERLLRHVLLLRDGDDLDTALNTELGREVGDQYGRLRWDKVSATSWRASLEALERTPTGREWLGRHPNFPLRIEAEIEVAREALATDGAVR